MVMFEIGGLVHDDGKSCGVALGERITAEGFELFKDLGGCFIGNPLSLGTSNEGSLEFLDGGDTSLAAKRAAQEFTLPRRELAHGFGDAQHLFLPQNYPQRLGESRLQ